MRDKLSDEAERFLDGDTTDQVDNVVVVTL